MLKPIGPAHKAWTACVIQSLCMVTTP